MTSAEGVCREGQGLSGEKRAQEVEGVLPRGSGLKGQCGLFPNWGLWHMTGYLGTTVLLKPRMTPGSGCGPSPGAGHRLPFTSWPRLWNPQRRLCHGWEWLR